MSITRRRRLSRPVKSDTKRLVKKEDSGKKFINLPAGEMASAHHFITIPSNPQDPVVKVYVADYEVGGGYLSSGGNKIREGGSYTSINVQMDQNGQPRLDLTFHGGRGKFTLIAENKSGKLSHPYIIQNTAITFAANK